MRSHPFSLSSNLLLFCSTIIKTNIGVPETGNSAKNNDFWESEEFNFMVIDQSKIGSGNTFGLLDALGHEFAHLNSPDPSNRSESHKNPSLWGTDTILNPNSLNSNTLAGRYGQEIQIALKNSSSQMWVIAGSRFITVAFMGDFLKKSVGAIRVPVNGIIKKVVPVIR
ncbi:MAG: hypothetical protein ACKO13_13395 [Cytophagales bacterium]